MIKKHSRLGQWLNKQREKLSPQHIFWGVLLLVGLTAGAVWLFTRPKPDPLDQITLSEIEDRGALGVGVFADVPLFATRTIDPYDKQSWSGLEVDIAHELAALIFDNPDAVEFTPVEFTLRNFMLNQERVDCLIALSPQGYSDSFIYSDPYYTDAVAVIVLLDGATTIEQLYGGATNGKLGARIGALTRQPQSRSTANPLVHQGALTVLQRYNENNSADFRILTYSDAHEMFEDLRNGSLDAIAMETAFLPRYFGDDLRLLTKHIGTIPYSVVAMPNQSSLIELVNIAIRTMKDRGVMAELLQTYGLKDYG